VKADNNYSRLRIVGYRILILCAVFAAAGRLSAADIPYVIGDVALRIEGKSNKSLLLKELNITPYKEKFSSEEDLRARAEERKQFLFNKRIFESVECTLEPIESTGEQHIYRVIYDITDGNTFLPIPFGKYDSNYGAKLGLKLFDKNLFGLLSDFTLDTSIRQINVTAVDSFAILSILDLSKLPIFNQRIDLSMRLDINTIEGNLQDGIFTGSISWNDISFFDQNIGVFSNITIKQYSAGDISTWGDPYLNAGFTWKGIPLLNEKLDIYFNTNLQNEGISWEKPELTFTTRLSSNTLQAWDKNLYAYIEHIFAYDTAIEDVTAQAFNTGAAVSFALPVNISYRLGANLLTDHSEGLFDISNISTTHVFRHGRINWNENFREGDATSLSFSTLMPINKGIIGLVYDFSTHSVLQSTFFTMIGDWLNMGFRGIGFLTTGAPQYFPVVPGEYMRGILDRHLPNKSGYTGITINTNFTFKLFEFTIYMFGKSPDGEFLISPFFDFSLFDTTPIADDSGFDWVRYTGGLEFYLIFDRFRSYPFTTSFGVDLQDAAAFIRGDLDFDKIEFELLLSLNMFY